MFVFWNLELGAYLLFGAWNLTPVLAKYVRIPFIAGI
jgi:hypothetical protein